MPSTLPRHHPGEGGGGATTSFWLDKWMPGVPLAQRFPALFSHCTRQQATVASVVQLGLSLQPRLTTAAEAELPHVLEIIDRIPPGVGRISASSTPLRLLGSAPVLPTACLCRFAPPTLLLVLPGLCGSPRS